MSAARKLGFAFLLIAGLSLVTLIVLFVFFPDSPPVSDDKELIPVRVEIKPEDNAFTYLNEATNCIWFDDDEYTNTLAILKAGPWTNDTPPALLTSNAQTFALIDRALSCQKYQVPQIQSYTTSISYVEYWRKYARLNDLRANYLWRTKGTDCGLAETVKTIRLGHLFEDADGSFVTWLVGVACKGIGLQAMEDTVQSEQLTSLKYRECVTNLLAYPSHTRGLQYAIKTDYQLTCSTIDDFRSGRLSRSTIFGDAFQWPYGSFLCAVPFFFQPETTKELVREYHSLILHVSERPMVEVPGREWLTTRIGQESDTVRFFLRGNLVGRMLAELFLPMSNIVLDRKAREDTQIRVLAVLMSLKAYQLDHKELPPSLQELVPDYLSAVPTDPFDGKPLRYSRERMVVYSVGSDFKDSDGKDTTSRGPGFDPTRERWYSDDIVFYLEPTNRPPRTAIQPVRP